MKRVMATAFALVFCACAYSGEFTWTGGGVSGQWTDPNNWDGSDGYPNAGDTASFTAGTPEVEITEDFVIGEGTLTLDIADGATLKVNASISGAGGITRNGKGRLDLLKANPFEGAFQSNGSPTQLDSDIDYGPVHVYDGGALGTKSASFSNGVRLSGAKLYLECGGGTLVFTIPITLCNMYTQGRKNLIVNNGSVDFKAAVTTAYRTVIGGENAEEIRFEEKYEGKSSYFQTALLRPTVFVFEKGLNSCTFYPWNSTATFRFGGPVTAVDFQVYNLNVICDAADIFAQNTQTKFGFVDSSKTNGGRIDLNGFDQTYPVLTSAANLSNCSDFGFTSPDDRPAQVILSGKYKNNLTYNGFFFGTAGLKWNPVTNNVFTIRTTSNPTKGALTVASGTVALTEGATFTALSKLAVASGGTFDVATDSGVGFSATEIAVEDGAKLRLPIGVALHTTKFTVGEEVITTPGKYAADAYPDLFEGAGSVIVDAVPCTWTGPAGGKWSEGKNWDIGEVPGAGHDVTILPGASVVIDETTALVNSLILGDGSGTATLAMTNWSACLKAKYLNILKGGVLTNGGAFTNEAFQTRVFVECTDLTVTEGGKIDLSQRGWSGSIYAISKNNGYGPGRGRSNVGASHGGYGAMDTLDSARPERYGDAAQPETAGSGGGKGGNYGNNGNGGGVVRIIATGAVVVNGEIAADGCGVSSASWSSAHDTAGAGGSIWITCATLSGSGSIHANGGRGDIAIVPWGPNETAASPNNDSRNGRAGGGGRIAIEYDAAKQATVEPALKISVAGGMNYYNEKGVRTTLATSDKYHTEAEPGTLKFTDSTLFYQLLGKGLSGRMLGIPSVTVEGDLDYTYGHLRFPQEGFTFEVKGNLAVSGDESRLEVGGVCVSNKSEVSYNSVWPGRELNALKVGGDLTVSGGGTVDIRAAATNGTMRWGGEVTVGGKMTVGEKGTVYAWCNPRNLGAPHFTVGSLEVAGGGVLSADNRGGAGGWAADSYNAQVVDNANFRSAFGKGAGRGEGGGSSHGGVGGKNFLTKSDRSSTLSNPGVISETDFYEPIQAGAGGLATGYGAAGNGGGIIHVEAAGSIVVNGKVSADTVIPGPYQGFEQYCHIGAGAGGTVFLYGDTFTSGATAEISARGGDSWAWQTIGGCGGGGCIAVWTGRSNVTDTHIHRGQKKRVAATVTPGELGYLGMFNVRGGTNVVAVSTHKNYRPVEGYESVPVTHGGEGTIRFMDIAPLGGLLMIVR